MMPERVEWSDSVVPVGICCRPPLALSSMGALSSKTADLAVDKLEAALGIGDLLAEAGGKLGEEIAVFAGGRFGVEVQLRDVPSEQRVPLSIEGGDVAFGVLDLARDAEKLGSSAFTGDGGINLA